MSRVLITGGAGFIGSNFAAHLVRTGHSVTILDNLSRPGSAKNLAWLRDQFGTGFEFAQGDICDAEVTRAVARNQDAVFHLAAQVAVTTSVANPREDFEINALGTFNVLEGARLSGRQPLVVYASTNKVYGGMEDLRVVEAPTRWVYADLPAGLSESYGLDFHSPYGCSKGAGDQYVRDYARIYGLPTVVFRQSCIYGPRQFGVEDQGWLAHFTICAALGRPISIYGDGKQTRDMLWVDDLVDAYDRVLRDPGKVAGRVYNVGGGPEFTFSIWCEVAPLLAELAGRPLDVRHGPWRPGDQKVFICDITRARQEFGWAPRVAPKDGLRRLWTWVAEHRGLFE